MPYNPQQFQLKYAQIIARAWVDEAFKQQLLADPVGVLQSFGLKVQPGYAVKVFEAEANTLYLPLPPKPAAADGPLADDAVTMLGCVGEDPDPNT